MLSAQFIDRLLILRNPVGQPLSIALKILKTSFQVLVLDVEVVVLLLVVGATRHQEQQDNTDQWNDDLRFDDLHVKPPCNAVNTTMPLLRQEKRGKTVHYPIVQNHNSKDS